VADQNWKIVGVADFNNDGKPDILWRNVATGENYIGYMDGITNTGGASLEKIVGADWLIFDIAESGRRVIGADFNRDGHPDLLWRNKSTGEVSVWHMDGVARKGDGASVATVADHDWKIAGIGDFNKDAKVDILWRNGATGEIYLWYMNGTTVNGGATIQFVADQNWKIAGVADFNNDGRVDILWRNEATGENYAWYMNGAAVTGGASIQLVADQNWKIVGAIDFNDDARVDILWRNTNTGENYVWYMNGAIRVGGASIQWLEDQNWVVVPQGSY
jgi:hypothetical protein